MGRIMVLRIRCSNASDSSAASMIGSTMTIRTDPRRRAFSSSMRLPRAGMSRGTWNFEVADLPFASVTVTSLKMST